ncbi:CPA2 family monovalent cation:H+ antiporter-2 [Rhodoblastus acidophilus]|uniref:cation:proton antiporter domain-containing protein n=1 Tax=Rhodoblastus acidophilus TaxID=1074 RepID=UPI0022241A26|nr:cation:proton antiporter [Rhodoblastus acidophilus]MCW2284844.1 CPA2 family monovalent cation:H+ antiporter-2 [Rhodoblastus acidophilus]MCW2333866.1 CPA2 family monovalent cation:H+ antiporter-2 [Rhodoblastus acidophilus]
MPAHLDLAPYQAPLLFLVAAGVVVPLFKKLRLSPVLGFLLAGMLIGPHGLGRINEVLGVGIPFLAKSDQIATLAEFGVVFLMFNMGLELSLERLILLRRYVFGLGAAQAAACGLALMICAHLFGQDWAASATLGIALALSSTAIVVPVLAEKKRLNSFSGRAIFSVLLFQDLLVAPLLLVMSMSAESGHDLLLTLGYAFAALGLIAGVGRVVLRPFFQLVAAARSNDLFIAACLLVVIATAVAAASAGLSMALGAFIAGLLLAETEYRRAVELTIAPFQGLLLGLFFVSVGADLDPLRVIAHPVTTLGLALGLTALKAPIVAGLARAFGAKGQKAREIGLLLAPGGEFAFLILAAAVLAGIVSKQLADDAMIAVTLSMTFIPLIANFASRKPKAGVVEIAAPELAAAERVLIIGYGRVGQIVAELMRAHQLDYICIDADPGVAAAAREKGEPVYWGEATRPDFLANCGLATAKAVVITMHTPSAVDEVVRIARAARPDLTIVARARDALHARHLYALGATDAVPETTEASLQLSEAALVDIGVPMGLVIASIHEQRDLYRKALIAEGDVAATAPRPFSARRKKR